MTRRLKAWGPISEGKAVAGHWNKLSWLGVLIRKCCKPVEAGDEPSGSCKMQIDNTITLVPEKQTSKACSQERSQACRGSQDQDCYNSPF